MHHRCQMRVVKPITARLRLPPQLTNLSEVFQKLGPQFEAATGIHPIFSFGSTAQLALQIENGAPFDVYTAADVEHVDQLAKKGLLLPGSPAVYATGILALWIPPGSTAGLDSA
jgi:molybdate transport system substrate-binding protein